MLAERIQRAPQAALQRAEGDAGVVGDLLIRPPLAVEPVEDAALVVQQYALTTVRIDLAPAYDALIAALQPVMANPDFLRTRPPLDPVRGRVPLANIKPRLRMTALYFLANTLNYLVAGTGNRSEIAVGYFTKWGDGGVDLLPLGRLTKRQVRAMAEELGVPRTIIERPPSADDLRGVPAAHVDVDSAAADPRRAACDGRG